MKTIALFIPCYIDTIYPNVAEATYKLLKSLDFNVKYPQNQTCCGQVFANSGFKEQTTTLAKNFIDIFKNYDYIVAPSASCVNMVKNHYQEYLPYSNDLKKIQDSTFEICEFLYDIVQLKSLDVKFYHKVGFHQSCHGLRELNLATPSELIKPYYSKPKALLEMVEGIELVELKRPDECCGFGGTFSINEPELSIQMGLDRIDDHLNAGAEYIVGYDSSCLMHMQGIIKANQKQIKIVHIVEILAGELNEQP